MNWITVLSSIFALVGAVMLVAAQRQLSQRRAFLKNSAIACGTIIALIENRERDEISYFPKIKFQTSSGRDVTFQSEMASQSDARKMGDTVTVRYNAEQPDVAEIDEFMALWGLALLWGILGIVFLFVGVGILTGLLIV